MFIMIKKSENMEKKSILQRSREHVDISLIVFELIVSVISLLASYFTGSLYFRGVGIGLVIAWVTSAIAYWKLLKFK